MPASSSSRELVLESDGLRLAAILFMPAGRPRGSLLVCHGAGSCKENHAIMAEQAAAHGLGGLVFDFRGHGNSDGLMDAHAEHDVIAAAELLLSESGAPWVAARGSSMGAYWLLKAAREREDLFRSLVVLCPADESALLIGLDRFVALTAAGDPEVAFYGRFDVEDLSAALKSSDLIETARGTTGVLLAHSRDDEDVPFSVSERLLAVLEPPKRLIALDSGGHHGPQRSPEVARATIDWVLEHA